MGDPNAHYLAGLKLFGDGKHVEAIEEYTQALADSPDWADCLQALSTAQMNAGLLDDAIETAKRVTELAPDDPLAFTGLSMAYVKKEMIAEAEAAQSQARLLSWKQELATNPNAPRPEPPPGALGVQQ